MTLKQLQFFKRIAELENISKAANELYIAQPALSKAIKDLEKDLGYSLFNRNGKRITLNSNGEILYRYATQIQADLCQLENELSELNKQKNASVNVSVRVASKLLPDILRTFYSKNPNTNLKIFQINHPLKDQPSYDIIIDSTDKNTYDSSKQQQLILDERIMLAIPKSYPLAKKDVIRLNDLHGLPCCLLNEFSSLGKMVRAKLTEKMFTPNVIFESDSPHMIREFLEMNLSYSFVPEKTWELKKAYPNLILREISDFDCHRYIYLTYNQKEYLSQSATRFASHVIEYFAQLSI